MKISSQKAYIRISQQSYLTLLKQVKSCLFGPYTTEVHSIRKPIFFILNFFTPFTHNDVCPRDCWSNQLQSRYTKILCLWSEIMSPWWKWNPNIINFKELTGNIVPDFNETFVSVPKFRNSKSYSIRMCGLDQIFATHDVCYPTRSNSKIFLNMISVWVLFANPSHDKYFQKPTSHWLHWSYK